MPAPAPIGALLDDVRGFLSGLRRDWPDLFVAKRPAPPVARVEIPTAVPGTAEATILDAVRRWSVAMAIPFGKLRVKDQRTLWGSCTRRGDLNFNWRLTLAPPEVLDYVVIHELAHRLEMNHSRRFWGHVARFCPDYRQRRRWLRVNGAALFDASPTTAARPEPTPASR